MSVRLLLNLEITDLKNTNLNIYLCQNLFETFLEMNVENQGIKLSFFNFQLFRGPLLLGSTICYLLPSMNLYHDYMHDPWTNGHLRGKHLKKKFFCKKWRMRGGGWTVLGRQCPRVLCSKM